MKTKTTNGNAAAWGEFNDLPRVGVAMPNVAVRLSDDDHAFQPADRFAGLEDFDHSLLTKESENNMVSLKERASRVVDAVRETIAPSAVAYEQGFIYASDMLILRDESKITAEMRASNAAMVEAERRFKAGEVTPIFLDIAIQGYRVAAAAHSALPRIRERIYFYAADPQLRSAKERLQRQITHVANLMQTARVELARLEESVVIVEDDIRRFKACPDQPAEDAVAAKKRLALRHELIEEARERHAQRANEYNGIRAELDQLKQSFFESILA